MTGQMTGKTLDTLYFFFGTLRHAPLRDRVFGRAIEAEAATLQNHETRVALTAGGQEQSFPILAATPGTTAEGVLVHLGPAEAARMAFYELGYESRAMTVIRADGRPVTARVLIPEDGHWRPGARWSLEDWCAEWGAVCVAATDEYMALMGRVSPEVAVLRYPMILVRAASALRARSEAAPAGLRRDARPEDIETLSCSQGYARFFAVEDYRLRHRHFDGTMSRPLERAVFVSGDATVVLPYDPVRDRVLLVEQIRMGPMARGAANAWQIEAIAGRVDPDETPEQAARREAGEEAGLALGALIPAPRFYPSPGAKSEYLYCYLALADLPDGTGRPGGLEAEGEDIRPHLVSFAELMHLIDTAEVENGPLIVLALWLAQHRDRLRADPRPIADRGNLA